LSVGIPSSDVMPLLSGDIKMKKGDSGMKEGEDFALDKNAKVTYEDDQDSKNNKGKADPKLKGNLSDIMDAIAKKREQFDKHITQGEQAPTPMDTPSNDPDYKPDGGSGDNAEAQVKDKVQSTLTAIASRGLGKGGPRSLTKKVFETKTNWKQLLRNFVIGMEKTRLTWSKPRKKAFAQGYLAPGDIDIDAAKSSSQQILQALHSLPYEGGGTTLSCVKQYLDKKYPIKKFNGFIVFTDGYIESQPEIPNIKNKLFFIVEKGSKSPLDKYGPVHEIDVYH